MIGKSSRRGVLLGSTAAALTLAVNEVVATPNKVEELATRYFTETEALQKSERALRAALDEAEQLQKLIHTTEDGVDMLLDALEATPARTAADALAKVKVGRALVREEIDHRRHEFLAAALDELEALSG